MVKMSETLPEPFASFAISLWISCSWFVLRQLHCPYVVVQHFCICKPTSARLSTLYHVPEVSNQRFDAYLTCGGGL